MRNPESSTKDHSLLSSKYFIYESLKCNRSVRIFTEVSIHCSLEWNRSVRTCAEDALWGGVDQFERVQRILSGVESISSKVH